MAQQSFIDTGAPLPISNATAAPIGSGPSGETCGTCAHSVKFDYHGRTFHKCGLMERFWTHGQGSDIRLKWPACKFWEGNDG